MDRPGSLRLCLALLATVAVLGACEPITLSFPGWQDTPGLPDAGPSRPEPEVDAGQEPEDAGPDGGVPAPGDAGPEDAGPDGGGSPPGDAGPDGGPRESYDAGTDGGSDAGSGPVDAGGDAKMTPWSDCEEGWQSRTVLPAGTRGYPRFGLDAEGEAYFVEYTHDFRMVSTKPGVTFADTGWVGIPWLGGVGLDGQGDAHMAISPDINGTIETVPTYFLRHTGSQWERTQMPSGRVMDFGLDSSGYRHALAMLEAEKCLLTYTHDRSGTLTTVRTGIELGQSNLAATLRTDAQGHAHVAYERYAGPRSIFYATNASGTWVSERVATGGAPTLAVLPSGVPYVLWSSASGLYLSVRTAPGVWTASLVTAESMAEAAVVVTPSGVAYVLHKAASKQRLDAWTDATGEWVRKTLVDYTGASLQHGLSGMHVVVDAQGRVHVMYALLFNDVEGDGLIRRVDYRRQCP